MHVLVFVCLYIYKWHFEVEVRSGNDKSEYIYHADYHWSLAAALHVGRSIRRSATRAAALSRGAPPKSAGETSNALIDSATWGGGGGGGWVGVEVGGGWRGGSGGD